MRKSLLSSDATDKECIRLSDSILCENSVIRAWREALRFNAGDALSRRLLVQALVEIGAGGGSIAAIDAGGALRVGPRSAGAVPGR